MDLRTQKLNEGVLLVQVHGRLDARHIDALKAHWSQDGARHIIADLSETTFIDSMGLATLVSGLKYAKQHGGSFIIVNPSEAVRVILELTAMDKVFRFADEVTTAIKQVTQS